MSPQELYEIHQCQCRSCQARRLQAAGSAAMLGALAAAVLGIVVGIGIMAAVGAL